MQGGLLVPFKLAVSLGAGGGLAGLLFSASALGERDLFHEQELQSGNYLLIVETEPDRLESARQILLSSAPWKQRRRTRRP